MVKGTRRSQGSAAYIDCFDDSSPMTEITERDLRFALLDESNSWPRCTSNCDLTELHRVKYMGSLPTGSSSLHVSQS